MDHISPGTRHDKNASETLFSKTMKVYLENFLTFEEDVDNLLNKYDRQFSGLFGKDETKEFLNEIS